MKKSKHLIAALTITLSLTGIAILQSASATGSDPSAVSVSENDQLTNSDPCAYERSLGVKCSFIEFEDEVIEVQIARR